MELEIVPIAPPNKPPCSFDFPESIENSSEFLFTYSLNFNVVDEKPKDRWKLVVERSMTPPVKWTYLANAMIAVFSGALIFYGFFVQYIRSIASHPSGMQSRGWKSLRSEHLPSDHQ